MIKLLTRGVLLATLLFLPVSQPVADIGTVCTSVAIELPDKIVLHGSRGDIHAHVTTRLPPGQYTIRYSPDRGHFVVSPEASTQSVVYVSLHGVSRALGRRYEAYVDSMRRGVPLVITDGTTAGVGPPCKSCPRTTQTTQRAPSAPTTLASLTAEARPDNQLPIPGKPVVGWMTYLRAERLANLPANVPCKTVDVASRGTIFIVTDEHRFSADNPDDVARALALTAFLKEHGALEEIPVNLPV